MIELTNTELSVVHNPLDVARGQFTTLESQQPKTRNDEPRGWPFQ
jgi:hypothetical protein